jgi:hypothetical protein
LKDLWSFLYRCALIGVVGTLGTTHLAWAAAVDLYAVYCGPSCDFVTNGDPIFRLDGVTGAPLGRFATVLNPEALTFGPNNDLYATDVYTQSVLRFDRTTGEPLASIPVVNPGGLAFGPDGDLYVAGRQAGSILRFDGASGAALGVFASVVNPGQIAFGPDGNLYVNDGYTNSVLRFNGATGAPMGSISVVNASGLTFGPDQNLYVGSVYTESILRFDGTTGAPLGTFASVVNPGALAFGPDGNLYVQGRYAGDILRFDGSTGAPLNRFVVNAGLFTFGPSSPIPEPAEIALTALGLLAVVLCVVERQWKRKKTVPLGRKEA